MVCSLKWLVGSVAIVVLLTPARADFSGSKHRSRRGECLATVERVLNNQPLDGRSVSRKIFVERESFADQIRETGHAVTRDDLRSLGIPEAAIPFYDLKTGRFNYRPKQPRRLAVENGDAKIDFLHINWGNVPEEEEISRGQLRQFGVAMQKDPSLKVQIDASRYDSRTIDDELALLPKDVRKRVEVLFTGEYDDRGTVIWSQDAAKPLEARRTALMPPSDGTPWPTTQSRLRTLAASEKITLEQSIFDFAGGNIVVGERHAFVGPDIVKENMHRLRISAEDTIRALSAEFGKPVLVVGAPTREGKAQVDFHIDLTMAVVRDRRTKQEVILLDSLEKAYELLKTDTELERTRGEKNLERLLDPAGKSAQRIRSNLSNREPGIRAIKAQLEAKGYKIIEVPGINARDDDIPAAPGQPDIVNFTNSIFSGRTALIPESGVRVFDRYMKKVLTDLGYDVTSMPVTHQSFCLDGGSRCLTGTYRR